MFTMAMFNRLPVELGRMRMIFHELDLFSDSSRAEAARRMPDSLLTVAELVEEQAADFSRRLRLSIDYDWFAFSKT